MAKQVMAMTADTIFLLSGQPLVISKKLKVRHPTLSDVISIGEQRYWSALNCFTAIPSDAKSALWKVGLDWEKVSDFDFFAISTRSATPEESGIFFDPAIDFTKARAFKDNNGDTGLYCPDVDLVIDYVSYRRIADFLQKVHRLKKQPERAGNAFTKKMLIRLDEEDHARQAREPFQSKLGNLMSAACNMPGFKYNYQEIQQLPMGAFIDSVIRLQIIKNAEQLISGIYAGTIDSKKINKKKLDWTRPLEAGE